MLGSIAAVCAGASLGALARWFLSVRLNPLSPALPLGTLAANLVGGYLVGVAVAVFSAHPQLPPQVRLFVVTGLLGGLQARSRLTDQKVYRDSPCAVA